MDLLSICNYGIHGKPLENPEMPVGKSGISFGIGGKPLENLDIPVGTDGICFGMDGKPLENHWKTWKCPLEKLA